MEIRVSSGPIAEYSGDAVMVAATEGGALAGDGAEVDARLGGLIGRLAGSGEIRGKQSEVTVLHTQGKLPAERVAVVGVGPAGDADAMALRRGMGAAARALRDRGCRRVGVSAQLPTPDPPRPELCTRATVEGVYTGLYRGEERKTKAALPEEFEELCLLGVPETDLEAASVVRAAQVCGEATNYARRLVNLPANDVTPARLTQEAVELGLRKGFEVEVVEPRQMRDLGMGALLAVAGGSDEPARLIVMRHRGKGGGPQVGFIGKGLTFDSGGISIKPSEQMHLMKSDMAGAAAVLAAMGAAAELKLGIDLLGLIPATENMVSGRAYRPGDVLTAFGGKTIEVISTDAEGRLVLADALGYARQLGATHLIDVATLTGACVIALGHAATGVMGNDNELVEAVLDAGEAAGERGWRLPLFPEYRHQLDSKIADIKNVGGRPAGPITGAFFLKEFVGETSWVHLDIAGTAWSEKDEPHQIEGATGAGTRTLVALAERMAGGVT